jgi:hypothetical protein
MFNSLQSLGSHFNISHRATILNDNGDGTLSIRTYRQGIGKLPAKVMSKNKLDPKEPPMLAPCLPPGAKTKVRAAAVSPAASFSPSPSTTTAPTAVTREPHGQYSSDVNSGYNTAKLPPRIKHMPAPAPPSRHESRRLRSETVRNQPKKEARNDVREVVHNRGLASAASPAVNNAPDMVMEDWEIAPGRMRNSSTGAIESEIHSSICITADG